MSTKKVNKKKTTARPKPSPASKSRAKSKPTKSEFDRIADSWEAKKAEMDRLISENPENALHIACERFDYAFAMYIRLIEKKALYEPLYCKDGSIAENHFCDTAADSLSNRLSWFMKSVSNFARAGEYSMIHTSWFLALELCEAIHDIALDRPDRIESLARSSLFMPSLRARPKNFVYDFPSIANATHLSEDCLFAAHAKSAHHLDKHPTRFVAEILRGMAYSINSLNFHKRSFAIFQDHAAKGVKGFEQYASMSFEKWLVDSYHAYPHEIHYDKLPPLTKSSVPIWWKEAVKSEVERNFEKVKHTRFYKELQAATETGKDYEVLDELKRRCRQALRSLARPD